MRVRIGSLCGGDQRPGGYPSLSGLAHHRRGVVPALRPVLHRADPNTSPPSGINPKALRSRLRMRGCMHPRMLRRMHRSIVSRGCMCPLLTSSACTLRCRQTKTGAALKQHRLGQVRRVVLPLGLRDSMLDVNLRIEERRHIDRQCVVACHVLEPCHSLDALARAWSWRGRQE